MVQARWISAVVASSAGAFALVLMLAAVSPAIAQTVDLDPDSGERVSAPAASAVPAASADPLRFSSEGLTAVAMPNGGVTVDLEGRFHHYLVAHKGPDGKLHMGCSQDADSAHPHSAPSVELGE